MGPADILARVATEYRVGVAEAVFMRARRDAYLDARAAAVLQRRRKFRGHARFAALIKREPKPRRTASQPTAIGEARGYNVSNKVVFMCLS